MLLGLWLFVILRVKEESQKACVAMSLAAGFFFFFLMPGFILVPLSRPIQWHHTWYRVLPPDGKKILKINWNYVEPSRC